MALAVVLLGCSEPPAWLAPHETVQLAPDLRIERRIENDTSLPICFDLDADQFVHLGIEQQGVDVVARLLDPRGELVVEVDGPTGKKGVEHVFAVASSEGRHCLQVQPFRTGAEGPFAFEVLELRNATVEDRWRSESSAAVMQGDLSRARERYQEAVDAYRRAIPGLKKLGDRTATTRARWHLGEALIEVGQLSEALAELEEAADSYQSLNDGLGEARVLNDLGALWRELGESERAMTAHRRSLELYRQAKVAGGEGSALNNLGLVAQAVGDLAGALGYFEQSLAIWRPLDSKTAQASTLQNLGSLYALIGRDEEAVDHLRQAVSLLTTAGEERRLIGALTVLGWAHDLAGQHEVALEHYRKAIALARRLDDPRREAGALDRQGSAYLALRRFDEAIQAYEQSLRISRSTGRRLDAASTLFNLGWLELSRDEPKAATEPIQEALSIFAETGDRNDEIYASVGLARAVRLGGDLDRAEELVARALELVEKLRFGVPGELSRSHFLDTRYDVYEEAVTLLAELHHRNPSAGYSARALELAEKARARGLLEALVTRQAEGVHGSPERQVRSRLLAEIRALENRRLALIARRPIDPRIPALEKLIRQRWLDVEKSGDTPATENPPTTFLGADQIRALLDADTLLIVYFLAEPHSFAWTVDRERIEVHELPPKNTIEDRARQVAFILSQQRGLAYRDQGARALAGLSEAALEPLEDRLVGFRRLVVLSDGALHIAPFCALPISPGSALGGKPLLTRHEIVFLPSASVLDFQRRTFAGRPLNPSTLAVIADPVVDPDDRRLKSRPDATQVLPEDLERSIRSFDLEDLKRLPATADEAAAILRLVPRHERFSAESFQANRRLVDSGILGRYRIVHFATHGLVHPIHPGLSGLVLSLFDEQGQPQDGFLRAYEVSNLDLPAELVVLSACRTGSGRELRGEGLVGLTQAFFKAGARRVIVSSWNVSDKSTAILMADFYRRHLRDGLQPAAALRQAQLSLLSQGEWSRPYFWAAFSFVGDWR